MIVINQSCLDDEIIENHFVCDLAKCKGACCVAEGAEGAPLDVEEVTLLEEIYEVVKPYLTPEGIETIAQQGFTVEHDGKKYTPTINNRDCAYIHHDDSGIAQCGIEKAYLDGKISFKKPISCHLYPIRIKQHEVENVVYDLLYYHKWDICAAACELGNSLQVPIYQFLKEPLIRKYGKDWYEQLEEVIKEIKDDE